MVKNFIPLHDGYQKLYSYQKAEIIYDATVYFTGRYFSRGDRTIDQMVQAVRGCEKIANRGNFIIFCIFSFVLDLANFKQVSFDLRTSLKCKIWQNCLVLSIFSQPLRSGKQNIAEASVASGTSKESEIKLTNVARASLEELLIDYRDFLRLRNLEEWDKHHPYTLRLRELTSLKDNSYDTFRKGIENDDPAICANVIIGLIKVANYLLDKQIKSLEEEFLKNGGLRESMTRARLSVRQK